MRVLSGYGWKKFDNLNIFNYVFESKENLFMNFENWREIIEILNFKDFEKMWRVVLFLKFNDSNDIGVLF